MSTTTPPTCELCHTEPAIWGIRLTLNAKPTPACAKCLGRHIASTLDLDTIASEAAAAAHHQHAIDSNAIDQLIRQAGGTPPT